MAIAGLISSSSGLNVNSIVSNLMVAERQPINNLEAQRAAISTKTAALNKTKSIFGQAETQMSRLSTLSSSASADTVKSAIKDFVTAYNNYQDQYKAVTDKKAPLQGDASIIRTQNGLRNQLSTTYGSNTMRSLGLSTASNDPSGHLTFDEAKFDAAWSSSSSNVMDTLKQYGSAASTKMKTLTAYDGYVQNKLTALASKVTRIDKQESTIEDRLTKVEANYRKQFQAASDALASMNSTASSTVSSLTGSSVNTYA